MTKTPGDGETFVIGDGITVKPLHTPCHTQDSICYFMESATGVQRAVFTGDTLFIAGCGRFFEGDAAQMHKALNSTLAALPDDTKVYPGHEYTKSNVRFGRSVDDSIPAQKLAKFCDENEQTQGKFTIGDEKSHNVFMRVDVSNRRARLGGREPVDSSTDETPGPEDTTSYRQDGPGRGDGEAARDEK